MINLKSIRDTSNAKQYPKGTIFSHDGIGEGMYILLKGDVALLNSRDNRVIALVSAGDFFDEGLLFSEDRPPVVSLSITDVIALPILKTELATFFSTEPLLALELMREMYARIGAGADTGHLWLAGYDFSSDGFVPPVERAVEAPAPVEQAESSSVAAEDTSPAVVSSETFELFPAGHSGEYTLPLTNGDRENMCENPYKCPVCEERFTALKILSSRLVKTTTDDDTRKHYRDIDPTYYEVITCPHCYYSAMETIFSKTDDVGAGLPEVLKALKEAVSFRFGTQPDTAAIFASYYLALLCAPKCFPNAQLIEAKLLHRLSWLYHDCGDEQMEKTLTEQTLQKYLRAFMELTFTAEQELQVQMVIGELYFKLGNINEAKRYQYGIKISKVASAVMKKRAESRLEIIKELEKTSAPESPKPAQPAKRSLFRK